MEIKNEYVKVNIGKKQYNLKNTIMKKYLERFARSQIKGIGEGYAPVLNICYLRFGSKLIFDEETELSAKNFQKKLYGNITSQSIKDGAISTTYRYEAQKISDFLDKEITAIGFFEENKDECLACMDVYGLGITVSDFNSFFIDRKDTIKTNLEFIKNHRGHITAVDNVIHLIPGGNKVNGVTVDVFLEDIREGDKNGGYISPSTFVIDDSNVSEGVLRIDNTMHNEYKSGLIPPGVACPNSNAIPLSIGYQCNYIFLELCSYNHETGERMWNDGGYYVRFPIDIVGDYEISLKFERSEK